MLRTLASRFVGGLADFLSWWGEELAALTPPMWKSRLFPPDGRALLTIHPDVMVLTRTQAGEDELVLWRQPVMPAGGVEINDLTEAVGGKPVHIRFDAALGLSRQVTLPDMSTRDLGNAAAFQVEQLFPFRAEDVHVAHGAGAPSQVAGQVDVPVAVIERPVVDGWTDVLRGAGLRAASYAVVAGAAVLGFHRLPAPVDHRDRNLRAGLAGLTLILFAGTLLAWHIHRDAYVAFLERGIEERKGVAMEARKLSDHIAASAASRGWLEMEARRPDLAGVLEALAQHVPDTAWAEQLEWRGKQLRLQGYAEDAVALPKQVAAGGLFENVQFRAAMDGRGEGAKERFDLTADVKGIP